MLLIVAAILPLLPTNTDAQADDPHGWIGLKRLGRDTAASSR